MSTAPAPATPLDVEVYFDLICPWCWIGKRQLARALARYRILQPQRPVRVHWRSQQLLPGIGPQGLPFGEFYLKRLGSAAALAARQAQVRDAGAWVGLAFDFSAMPVMPNTQAAHGLLADAQTQCDVATVDVLIEDLFEAHFMHGQDLNDSALLDRLASRHGVRRCAGGLPPVPVASGVPLFVVEQTRALSGAQPPERLLDLLLNRA